MQEQSYLITAIAIMAATTFLTRAMPFLLGGRFFQHPFFQTVIRQIPIACMPILVIYCLKDVSFSAPVFGAHALASIFVVVGMQWFLKKPMLSIFAGTFLYLLSIRLF